MQQKVQMITKALYDCLPISIENAGRGFYGSVFKVTLQKEPFVVSIKIFDDPKYMLLQAKEQSFITSHKNIKMPKVFFVYQKVSLFFFSDCIINWCKSYTDWG